ncbi:MAG: PLP-dependent aminotransferase family protein [Lachnospiraceae bacterium]|nr:PLP-dependent aminotransferase family protein [Lachnospiraceae bacterium]
MNYLIDRSAQEPAYIQLYRYLVRDIVSGVYGYGTKMPSKRTIAEETGVSVITAEHALTILTEEGYIDSRERSGFFVTYRDEDFVTKGSASEAVGEPESSEEAYSAEDEETAAAEEGVTDFTGSAEGGLSAFPFSVYTKTMRRVILDYGEKIMIKSANCGCRELREELCRYLARSRGINVKPAQIVIGSGAEYLYGMIVQLLGTDKGYAIEKPSYGKIREVYEAMGARVDMLPMGSDGIISDALWDTKAEILHVTPFNSYPSGITADINKKKEYLRWAKRRSGVLIEDNYDSELTVSRKAEEPLFSMAEGVEVIYLNTFSGTIAPSIRIGYMILPESMLREFSRRLGFYSCTVPTFEQYVLAELLKGGEFERHINRVRREKRMLI